MRIIKSIKLTTAKRQEHELPLGSVLLCVNEGRVYYSTRAVNQGKESTFERPTATARFMLVRDGDEYATTLNADYVGVIPGKTIYHLFKLS